MATYVVAPEVNTADYGGDASQVPPQSSSRFATNDVIVTKNRFLVLTTVAVVVSVFFQTIALVSPGWNIVTSNSEILESKMTVIAYEGVYYSTTCVKVDDEEDCTVVSRQKAYKDAVGKLRPDSDVTEAGLDRAYNLQVHKMMDVQLAWFFTVFVLIFQLFKILKGKAYPRATVLSVIVLAVTCVLMYTRLFDAFVDIDFSRRVVSATESEDDSVGFPYSVLCYCFGIGMCFTACVLSCKGVFDYMGECIAKHSVESVRLDRERKMKQWYEEEMDKRTRDARQNHSPRPSPRSSPRSSPRPSPRPSSKPSSTRMQYGYQYDDKRRHDSNSPRDGNARHPDEVHLSVPLNRGQLPYNDGRDHFTFDVPSRSPRGSPRNSREMRDRDSHSPHGHRDRGERGGHSPRPHHDHHDHRSGRHSPRPHGEPRHHHDDERSRRSPRPDHPYEPREDRSPREQTNRRRSPPRDVTTSPKQEYELVPTQSEPEHTTVGEPTGSSETPDGDNGMGTNSSGTVNANDVETI